jgi:hypothetical protein
VNYKRLTAEYNQKHAHQLVLMIRGAI